MYSNSFDYVKLYLFFVFIYIWTSKVTTYIHRWFSFFFIFLLLLCIFIYTYFKMDIKSVFVCEWIFERLNVSVKRKHRWRMLKSVLYSSFVSSLPIINDRSSTYIASCVFCSKKKSKTMKTARRWWWSSYSAIQLSIEQSIVHDHQRRRRSMCHHRHTTIHCKGKEMM